MGDHERSTTVSADPDALFAYLSDVGNLPDYFAAMKSAEPAGGDAVRTVAEVEGTEREGEAWFRTDEDARSIEWGSEGPSDYRGSLEVTGDGDGARVTVRLHTEHVDDGRIEEGLDETLARIAENVDRGDEVVDPSPS